MVGKQCGMELCPFCGAKPVLKAQSAYDYGDSSYWVECERCGVRGKAFNAVSFRNPKMQYGDHRKAESEAERVWNRRTA